MSARSEMIAHYRAVRERMQPRPQIKAVEPPQPQSVEIVFVNEPPINLTVLKRRISLNDVFAAVAGHYEISLIDLASERRTKKLARARQMAFCVAREVTLASFPQMAAAINKDHSTAVYADQITRERMQSDEQMREDFNTICDAIRASKDGRDV
jgi:chromosomal replication initiation ATPase DnaA